ncbi:hypothetical protein EYZ11_009311 [Aspergillus tanneri]|uniref:Uncharacterized protein n=1 Tax=Aspergillus tanneri TaxID=1220188 RepID=A0A4S3JDN9_9EURO|nr:hypothetical protein EYZ11_009311 [Aspergillus tanneri]
MYFTTRMPCFMELTINMGRKPRDHAGTDRHH